MNIKRSIHEDWHSIANLLYQEPLKSLFEEVLPNISYQPNLTDIFKVYKTPIKNIRVVILGVEPYCNSEESTAYAFATKSNRKYTKSLNNIFEEIKNTDIVNLNKSGEIDLFSWIDQGVFLLNTSLTVQTGMPGSHKKYWDNFIIRTIKLLSIKNPCIWVLWGKDAQRFIPYINTPKVTNVDLYDKDSIHVIPIDRDYNYILKAPHPITNRNENDTSNFLGCNHFYYINVILQKMRFKKIIW